MSGGGMYLRENGALVPMAEEPYAAESVLQHLLADHPDLLAGDQIGGGPRRWLFVSRELPIATKQDGSGRWYIDHLFIDQDAIPTVVEVKRSTDTRIRREVVGQILDYAANAVTYWNVDKLRAAFEQTCSSLGNDPTEILAEHLGSEGDADAFWDAVKTNLAAGKVRLMFVGDEIPRELRRVVEFLNDQMSPAEVLAVEVKQYVGGAHQALVPRLIGQSEAARAAKGQSGARRWDRESILAEIGDKRPAPERKVAERIFDWSDAQPDLTESYGSGRADGSFQAGLYGKHGYLFPFVLYTYGRVEIQFQWMLRRPPFDAYQKRVDLQNKLNEIDGVIIPDDVLEKRPSIALSVLTADNALAQFLGAMDWALDEGRQVATAQASS